MNIPNTPYNELIEARHGTWCVQSKDKFMARGLRELGECGQDETDLLCSLVNPGDIVIDCGANIGLRTVPLAKKVTNSGLVFAFEPERINFLNLCANIAINSIYSAFPFNAAVGSKDGEVLIPQIDPWANENIGLLNLKKLPQHYRGVPVPIVTVDAFNLKPTLIKIDVEGMEAEVLHGAMQTISKHLPYIFCECFDNDAMNLQAKEIIDLPYDGYLFESSLWRDGNFKGVKTNEFGNVTSQNILYVPQGKPCPEGLLHCIKTGIPA
jgi:FkbM family methyltransferase